MAFETFKTGREPERLSDVARDVARRRAAAGEPQAPPNSGTRRTASKRALLDAIAATGKRWR